jgi:putative drug exporter of the RND superfamily
MVLPTAESPVPAGQATAAALEHALAGVPGVIGTGGDGAMLIDFNHAVHGQFTLTLALIAIATFILVARAFGSVLLAAKAVVFNLISLAAAYGVLTWVFQDGHGSTAIFGVPATGAITFWVPLMVFAFLFGLSKDYEVFILTCIREEYDATGDARSAVVTGLGRTGDGPEGSPCGPSHCERAPAPRGRHHLVVSMRGEGWGMGTVPVMVNAPAGRRSKWLTHGPRSQRRTDRR